MDNFGIFKNFSALNGKKDDFSPLNFENLSKLSLDKIVEILSSLFISQSNSDEKTTTSNSELSTRKATGENTTFLAKTDERKKVNLSPILLTIKNHDEFVKKVEKNCKNLTKKA